MRVVSDFHDYYDTVMQHGQDDRVVYERKTVTFEEPSLYRRTQSKPLPPNVKQLWDWFATIRQAHNTSRYSWLASSERISGFVFKSKDKMSIEATRLNYIFFAGKLYKAVGLTAYGVTAPGATFGTSESQTLYSAAGVIKALEHYKVNVEEYKEIVDRIGAWFDVKVVVDTAWFIENKLSVAVYTTRDRAATTLTINPNLKEYDFYRALDPYSAFQELDTWISGTLAWPQNFMVEVSDKSKVEKHGFDPKYGFRTRPKE